jgi:hypothetical protein
VYLYLYISMLYGDFRPPNKASNRARNRPEE